MRSSRAQGRRLRRRILPFASVCLLAAIGTAHPADTPGKEDVGGLTVSAALRLPDVWFESAAARTALEHVLSHQSTHGDWPKNIRTPAQQSTQPPDAIAGTFDNGATTGELRLLARAYRLTRRVEYQASFLRGFDHILAAQYTNGGWPQYSPPPARSYHRHITFNDGTMLHLIELVRDVAGSEAFAFVDGTRRQDARKALARALECVLRCQVVVNGRKTVWCAQHDEVTLEPRAGRSYELVSLSGHESAGVLLYLMSLESPTPAVVDAVTAGVRWFEEVQLTSVHEIKVDGDKRLIRESGAPSLWARFYEIGTNRPFYCGRDGVKKYHLDEIEPERRNGYSWHGTGGQAVLERFARWPGRKPQVP